tara:strand:- start:16 stop:540 length:525 start_codon:yes stop_codon:yes gene_type:complete
MKITKLELEQIIKEEIQQIVKEGAELKIPVERYDAFKRKIEQWGMLFNKFTGYTRDLNNQSFDRKTDGKRIVRMAHKLESELRKIMKEFDFDAKSYEDERYAQRQKLDRFDGDHEFFLEEDEVSERKLSEPEKKEKEKVVKGMKKDKKDFKKRYGDDAESVMYATATKIAKEKK